MQPGRSPRGAAERAFAALLGAGAANASPEAFVAALTALVDRTETGVVVLVDALEELVTVADQAEGMWLADVLAIVGRAPLPGVRVILTARRDFLDGLLAIPSLGTPMARSVQLVTSLSGRTFSDALEERLGAYGYALEDAAMRDELARQLTSAPEAMPLFEFALARLWQEGDHVHRRLGRAALARIGGIEGALEQHAERTLHELVTQHGRGAEAAARELLLALTTPSGTRTRRTAQEIAGDVAIDPQLIGTITTKFEQARLIVFDEGRLTLAHEALLQRWPRLHQWIAAVRQRRELALEIEQAAARWRERQDSGLLIRGRILRDARELLTTGGVRLSDGARGFITTSRRAEARGVTGVIALVSVVMIGLGVLFGLYRMLQHDAREKERAAEALAARLRDSRQTPEAERAAAVQALLQEKHACEKELRRCTGAQDAGAP
jgi:hypothetical protein